MQVTPNAGQACDAIDFDNDGSIFDPCDIDSFLTQLSEGCMVARTLAQYDASVIDWHDDG